MRGKASESFHVYQRRRLQKCGKVFMCSKVFIYKSVAKFSVAIMVSSVSGERGNVFMCSNAFIYERTAWENFQVL